MVKKKNNVEKRMNQMGIALRVSPKSFVPPPRSKYQEEKIVDGKYYKLVSDSSKGHSYHQDLEDFKKNNRDYKIIKRKKTDLLYLRPKLSKINEKEIIEGVQNRKRLNSKFKNYKGTTPCWDCSVDFDAESNYCSGMGEFTCPECGLRHEEDEFKWRKKTLKKKQPKEHEKEYKTESGFKRNIKKLKKEGHKIVRTFKVTNKFKNKDDITYKIRYKKK